MESMTLRLTNPSLTWHHHLFCIYKHTLNKTKTNKLMKMNLIGVSDWSTSRTYVKPRRWTEQRKDPDISSPCLIIYRQYEKVENREKMARADNRSQEKSAFYIDRISDDEDGLDDTYWSQRTYVSKIEDLKSSPCIYTEHRAPFVTCYSVTTATFMHIHACFVQILAKKERKEPTLVLKLGTSEFSVCRWLGGCDKFIYIIKQQIRVILVYGAIANSSTQVD